MFAVSENINMSYTVHELKSTKELKAFADFPNKLYKDNPYYIPGLLSDDLNMFNWKKIHHLIIAKQNTGL